MQGRVGTASLLPTLRFYGGQSVKLPDSKDFWSGVMLIAIGAGAVFIARDYPFGTALHMGAGFFPVVLGFVLVLFGLILRCAVCTIQPRSRPTGRSAPSLCFRSPLWLSASLWSMRDLSPPCWR